MIKNTLICVAILLVSLASCNKEDTRIVDGVYQFPHLSTDKNLNSDQIAEFYDLPLSVAKKLSTPGLVQTCLNYPYKSLIYASSTSPQAGFEDLIKPRFLGIRELESRSDRATCLLAKLQTINPLAYDPNWTALQKSHFTFDIKYLQLILSQEINLSILSETQKISTLEKSIDLFEKMSSDSLYDANHTSYPVALMGRLMLISQYVPMLDLIASNSSVSHLVADVFGDDEQTNLVVYRLALQYLTLLRTTRP